MSHVPLTGDWLLAVQNPLEAISEYLSRPVSAAYYLAGLAAVVLLTVGWFLANRLYQRRMNPEPVSEPGPLFEELCHAHNLSRGERALLVQMAECAQTTPAALFVAQSTFDRSADDLLKLPANTHIEFFDLVQNLRTKLFD